MSGVDLDGRQLRKGAADAVKRFVEEQGGRPPARLDEEVDKIARSGGTPLVVAQDNWILGVIHLKDIVKGGMNERFDELRKMGIRTVMITGDNRVTAAVIAQEAGVDDFLAEATPENKLALIKDEQGKGRMVAMTGDGTNDAPALAQADVGVAMNTGTSAAKEAGNMVDLDSNPTKLIEIVEVAKQQLITRGALTTFSIANDVAKYFAILPAMFAFTYAAHPGERGPLDALNIMHLGNAEERDPLRGHLQRADHPCADPARPPRRQVPGDRRDGAAAPQPAHLRARRRDPAVRRDQADRPARPQRLRCLGWRCVRGHYRILLGMAAGVGKTYRMLQEGRQAQAEGRDVVIGYLEPHDRPETAALADGLETVPRLRAAHGGLELEEMDVDAVIAARPELALIDELAHTNAPGMRHEKRYEDIEDVLAAGIDVISTVNVQHLESLNDSIFELTGVRVRETFPDRDPRRGRRGRARRPHAPRRCRSGCGRARSTSRTAPRSRCRTSSGSTTSARCASWRCASWPRTSRRGGGRRCSTRSASRRSPSACWRSSSRSRSRSGSSAAPGAPRSGSAPRSTRSGCASRAASRREEEATQLAALRRLSSVLGVHFLEEEGDDLVETVRRIAYDRGSTYIFVGTPDERRRVEILRGSLLSRMVRELPGIDIRVVTDRALREEVPE